MEANIADKLTLAALHLVMVFQHGDDADPDFVVLIRRLLCVASVDSRKHGSTPNKGTTLAKGSSNKESQDHKLTRKSKSST